MEGGRATRIRSSCANNRELKIWRPVLVKLVIIKLPHKSVFSATVVLFISLLCIFIGGTNFFFEVVAYYF